MAVACTGGQSCVAGTCPAECACDASICQTGSCEDAAVCGANQVIVLTPSAATFSTPSIELVDPSEPNHVWTTRYDFDVSAFAGGGTITFSGVVSPTTGTNPNACGCSFNLLSQCEEYPTSGTSFGIANASDVAPGSSWTMPYTFSAGTLVLHFGAEGDWLGTPGSMNTSTLSVTVMP
jgi:hypothetical protein